VSTYLVTGAAGFIASKTCELLLDEGHRVVGVDNMNDAYDVRLKEWRLARLAPRPGFIMEKLDICDRAALKALWDRHGGRFDAVVNLAARAGVRQSVENPWVYFETNATGTLNLLDLCRASGVKKFVLASTSSLYGKHNTMPYREDADTNRALSPYAASKKAAEAISYTYHYLYGIDVSVVRYFTVYGPAGRPDMSLFRFVQWIAEGRPVTVYGDGSQSRDFTFVEDIARGTIAALKTLGFETINLGSDQPAVLIDVIHSIEGLLGKKAKLRHEPMHPADVLATWADIGKARQLLGWEPRTKLEGGLKAIVDWYRENRAWAKDVRTD
jgi:nucleoside-diphosphate-sugar epimerase